MTAREALPGLLKSFVRYYDIKDEGVEAPFAAEAEFHSHEEQFFLVKQAKLSEAESKEFVFFGVSQHLTLEEAKRMDVTAWTRGMSRVFPHDGHRNSDVVLIILADQVDADAAAYLGYFYEYGLGVKEDVWTSQVYTLKAARQNSTCGIYRAGNIYSKGVLGLNITENGDRKVFRVEPDMEEAQHLWEIAADRGYEYAKVKIERIYDE